MISCVAPTLRNGSARRIAVSRPSRNRLSSLLELRLAPLERGGQAVLLGALAEFGADLGGRGIERRYHVHAGLHGVAESRRVSAAIDRELGGGERLGRDVRH